MIDDQIAALERAAALLQQGVVEHRRITAEYRARGGVIFDLPATTQQQEQGLADAATLRTLADSLRAGGERAQIVAWLGRQYGGAWEMVMACDGVGAAHVPRLILEAINRGDHLDTSIRYTPAIASGAHTEGQL